jgi:hypothetical protein
MMFHSLKKSRISQTKTACYRIYSWWRTISLGWRPFFLIKTAFPQAVKHSFFSAFSASRPSRMSASSYEFNSKPTLDHSYRSA